MTNIRLLVSDVDGTLVRNDKTLSPCVLAAVGRLRDAGIRLAVASSRATVGLNVLTGPLALDTPRAGFNGAVVIDTDDRVLQELVIPHAVCQEIAARLQASGLDIWVFADNRWLLTNPHQSYIDHERRALGVDYELVDDLEPWLARTHKMMATSRDFDAIAAAEVSLSADFSHEAAIHRSQLYHLDITNRHANKGAAALFIAQSLGIEPTHMACIGDMSNDIPMLNAAGLAIAMGNAPEAVRAHAHHVVPSNEQDGWAFAVDQLILQ